MCVCLQKSKVSNNLSIYTQVWSSFTRTTEYSGASHSIYMLWGNICNVNMRNLCILYNHFLAHSRVMSPSNKIHILWQILARWKSSVLRTLVLYVPLPIWHLYAYLRAKILTNVKLWHILILKYEDWTLSTMPRHQQNMLVLF